MRISLNLATRPFADLGPAMKRLRIAMAVLAILAILLVLGLRAIDQKAEAARIRAHSLDGQISRVVHERQSYQDLMRRPANAQLLHQVADLNKLFDDKTFSWTLAMEDLETVLPGGVQVTSLEPVRGKDGRITLHLNVLGPRDRAVDLVRNLEHSRRFVSPRISGESAESTGGPGERIEPVSESNRVNFNVLAEYNPATADERNLTRKRTPGEQSADDSTPTRSREIRPLAGRSSVAVQGQGRMPYTGSSQRPNRNPASGGPQ